MSRILEGKLALITGASRGIGVGISKNLASKGADLVLNYTSPSSKARTEELATTITSTYNVRAFPVQVDLSTLDGGATLIELVKKEFSTGGDKFQLDIIVHNAGIAPNNFLSKITAEDFDTTYNINVRGPLLLTQAAEPYLPHDRSGRIVCVSSVSATLGLPAQTVYGGSKAALEAMARTWARELAERCTVNSINPGPVGTEMWATAGSHVKKALTPFTGHTPLMQPREGVDTQEMLEQAKELGGGRPATVDEIAGVVGMLCTPDAAWITGQVVCANGGMIFATQ